MSCIQVPAEQARRAVLASGDGVRWLVEIDDAGQLTATDETGRRFRIVLQPIEDGE